MMTCSTIGARTAKVAALRGMCMDCRGRRLRTVLLLGFAFLAGVAIGPASGLIEGHFAPRASASRSAPANPQIPTDSSLYLATHWSGERPVRSRSPTRNWLRSTLNGMLTGLDPHSGYMNAEPYRAMQVETKGEFSGFRR